MLSRKKSIIGVLPRLTVVLLIALFSTTALSEKSKQSATKKEKVISIVGDAELPRVEAKLPWRVLSGTNTNGSVDVTPDKMPSVLTPIEVEEHRDRVYFDRNIKVRRGNYAQ